MKKTLGMLTIGSRKEFYISKGIFSSTHYFSVAMFIQAKHYYDDAGTTPTPGHQIRHQWINL